MTIKVAINGYGRIGRCVLRAIFEAHRDQEFQVVAINDLSGIKTTAHLTQYDSTHGRFPASVEVLDEKTLQVNGQVIQITGSRDPESLPWAKLGVDVVLECTGQFTRGVEAARHLKAGAKKVLISAPGEQVDATVVYGVNEHILKPEHTIVSNASCTTNCLAPVVKPLHEAFGIEHGLVNTVHAYTNDQNLLDAPHSDLRRARAAAHSIIPTKTGAASAVGLVLPELAGRLDGFAMRVPVMNVSVVDLTFTAQKALSVEAIHEVMKQAQSHVLQLNPLPLVSIDFNHHPASAIFDLSQTKVMGRLAKVVAWYDNEWGFSNRMLDTAAAMMRGQ